MVVLCIIASSTGYTDLSNNVDCDTDIMSVTYNLIEQNTIYVSSRNWYSGVGVHECCMTSLFGLLNTLHACRNVWYC
jgi:hypothetical protein